MDVNETPTERIAHIGRIATLDPGRYVVRLVVDDGHGGRECERLDQWQQRALVEACAQYDRVQAARAATALTEFDRLASGVLTGHTVDRMEELADQVEGIGDPPLGRLIDLAVQGEGRPAVKTEDGDEDTKRPNEEARVPPPGERAAKACRCVSGPHGGYTDPDCR